MATIQPPNPPHTPPPSQAGPRSQHESKNGLGIDRDENSPPVITTDLDYDIRQGLTDSPDKGQDTHYLDSATTMLSPTSATFPANGLSPQPGFYTPNTPQTASTDGGFPTHDNHGGPQKNPFGFTTVQYTAGKGSIAKGEALGRRKGHKYRHSSIHASHMDTIFQPPPTRRTPLSVPASLPMPTWREMRRSMTTDQKARLLWCFCHFTIAGYVQFSGAGSLAMTALSRLLLFDATGATVCVAVEVMSNFEVWKRSSIKHPFGLERADVLAGFGLAVFIAFMGLDVISHGTQHSLENLGHHESHTAHSHERVSATAVNIGSLLAIASTVVSAVLLKNHARIGRAMRVSFIAGWGKVLGNPSHFLTLSTSLLLLFIPLLQEETYHALDLVFSILVAALMIALGVRLGTTLASMLLMSYKPKSGDIHAVRETISEIESDPAVSAVQEARFWQVHYGLCMANLKLRYRDATGGYGDEMMRLRQRITSLIRQRLGEPKGVRWEVSVQMAADKD